MAAFTDKKGRTWNVDLDLRLARTIDKTDFTSFGIESGTFSILRPDRELFKRLILDAPFLFALIWSMVQEQAEAKPRQGAQCFPLSPKEDPEGAELEFVSGINGPVIESARNAMVEALSDFFPDSRIVLSTLMRQIRKAGEKIAMKMEEIDPLMDQLCEEEMEVGIAKLKNEILTKRESRLGEKSTLSQATPG